MTSQFSQIRWGRVLWTALTVYGASFLIIFLIVTLYATSLAMQAQGAPDPSMIQSFANRNAPWIGKACSILFTFLGTLWMARFVKTAIELHGLILGILVSLVSILFGGISSFNLNTLLVTALIIGSGWLGGWFAAKRE